MTGRETVGASLVLYPESFASPRDFPVSGAVEISRLRFTSLEMTENVVSVEMTENVVSVEMTESVVPVEMTESVVPVEMTESVVPVEMTESVVPVEMTESVVSLAMTENVVSVEMTGGVGDGQEIPQNQLETVLVRTPNTVRRSAALVHR